MSRAERVWGDDERVRVDPMTSPPYKWICFLEMRFPNKKWYAGTGFKINITEVDRTAIVTAGHNTYWSKDGGKADKIVVTFPGQDPITVTNQDDIYAAPEYIESERKDYDYGLILLPGPGTSDDGFGWSAVLRNAELHSRLVAVCGYPGDKTQYRTMWITGGPIKSYTAHHILYMNDSYNGQSGCPVYTWHNGYWTVLGIHVFGGYPNGATRFTVQMIHRFLEFMDGLKLKNIESVAFPKVFLRCDGKGVTHPLASGGGTVNCQYDPPGKLERFYIYPVEMTPSLASEKGHKLHKVVIESQAFKDVFIRMDSKGMSKPEGSGGGLVNCHYTAGQWEIFFMEPAENGDHYSFRSVQFPHCYIRLDGSAVHSPLRAGGGTVNCQWYDRRPTTISRPYETFDVKQVGSD